MKSRSWLKVLLAMLLVMALASCFRQFGRDPRGKELAGIDTLPNYKNGGFQNQTAHLDSGVKHIPLIFLHGRSKEARPSRELPWVKTDLKTLAAPAPTVVWFGHSSFLIKTSQGNILVDPVFSNHAGPVPGLVTAFKGTTHYHAEDMPQIDVLIISHNHYDHLDYRTIKKLKSTTKMFVVPVGIASDLIYWGVDPKKIVELYWNQSTTIPGGIKITAAPAQHKSNRSYGAENKTLWASYVIQTAHYKLYYGGDGGYGPHFKQIGKQYGPFDLAFLECGQYSPNYPWTHLLLGQPAQAAVDLRAKMLQPVHWAKFVEAQQSWNEPIIKLIPAAQKLGLPLNIPEIGEPYILGDPPKTAVWWDFK